MRRTGKRRRRKRTSKVRRRKTKLLEETNGEKDIRTRIFFRPQPEIGSQQNIQVGRAKV